MGGYRTSLRVGDMPRRLLPGEIHPLEPLGILLRFRRECEEHKIGSTEAGRLFSVWPRTIRRWWALQRMPPPRPAQQAAALYRRDRERCELRDLMETNLGIGGP